MSRSRLASLALAVVGLALPAWSLDWSTAVTPKPRSKNKGNVAQASIGEGNNIAVLFAGYDVSEAQTKTWAEGVALSAATKLTDFNVGTVFAVPGPADAGFRAREIRVDALAAAIASQADSAGAKLIIFAAHSSGAAVAEATLTEFAKKAPKRLASAVYYRLDGGGGLAAGTLAKLGGAFCVAAKCGARLMSQNNGACYGKYKRLVIDSPNACKVGWCCHLALINTRPKTLTRGDAKDYTTFDSSSRPQGGWLDLSSATLKSKAGL